MNFATDQYGWYAGDRGEFKDLPWLHVIDSAHTQIPMPWKVIYTEPQGYIVMESANGNKFKMFRNLCACEGDIIS
jgi:hypothetical protein